MASDGDTPQSPNDHEPLSALNPRADRVSYSPLVMKLSLALNWNTRKAGKEIGGEACGGFISSYSGYRSFAL